MKKGCYVSILWTTNLALFTYTLSPETRTCERALVVPRRSA
jgi:hypothetical protein